MIELPENVDLERLQQNMNEIGSAQLDFLHTFDVIDSAQLKQRFAIADALPGSEASRVFQEGMLAVVNAERGLWARTLEGKRAKALPLGTLVIVSVDSVKDEALLQKLESDPKLKKAGVTDWHYIVTLSILDPEFSMLARPLLMPTKMIVVGDDGKKKHVNLLTTPVTSRVVLPGFAGDGIPGSDMHLLN